MLSAAIHAAFITNFENAHVHVQVVQKLADSANFGSHLTTTSSASNHVVITVFSIPSEVL